MGSEVLRHYRELLRDVPELSQSIFLTAIQPVGEPLGVADIAGRLGRSAADLEKRPIDLMEERECIHIGQVGSSFLLLEPVGFAGARPEVLRRLSSADQ
ncbi:hypothetical protein [Acrocarpospora phusangensis]|nr:hypothetical protein [Acrocarpospora phusangensis]